MKKAFEYLKKLRVNNNRVWFEENRNEYDVARAEVEKVVEEIRIELQKVDVIESKTAAKSMQRIYRDIRFSKDKTPYKQHFGGKFTRATKMRRGGYYFHFEPGNTFVVAAFWSPSKEDLAWIRSHLAQDIEPLLEIVNDDTFVKEFGELKGEKLKNGPRDFENDHPNVEWLKYKQFLVFKNFEDKEVLNSGFPQKAVLAFQKMLPFLNYMSEILTTDLNGEEV